MSARPLSTMPMSELIRSFVARLGDPDAAAPWAAEIDRRMPNPDGVLYEFEDREADRLCRPLRGEPR